jgi:hypothetical protein
MQVQAHVGDAPPVTPLATSSAPSGQGARIGPAPIRIATGPLHPSWAGTSMHAPSVGSTVVASAELDIVSAVLEVAVVAVVSALDVAVVDAVVLPPLLPELSVP